jgi:hypothetical protein
VAYARKARSVTMADAHVVGYSSTSLGSKATELVLAKDAIQPGDRVRTLLEKNIIYLYSAHTSALDTLPSSFSADFTFSRSRTKLR